MEGKIGYAKQSATVKILNAEAHTQRDAMGGANVDHSMLPSERICVFAPARALTE